jgi:serine protease Do
MIQLLPILFLALAAQDSDPVPNLEDVLRRMSPEDRIARRITPEAMVVQQASPAVVFIETDQIVEGRDFFGRIVRREASGSGSGFVILKDGFIVTNNHVIANAQRIQVSFAESVDPNTYTADVLSTVPEEDLALIKLRNPDGKIFPTVPMGTSSDLMIGEKVIAIGNPYGHTHTVSTGIISGLHRNVEIAAPRLSFDDLIQTDASINFGNSGGPLLNINGELIGINTAVNAQAENIGFAIPVDRVRLVLKQQLLQPDTYRAWLGFKVEDESPVISSITPESPAAIAGLKIGDRITELNDQGISSIDSFRIQRIALQPGRAASLTASRGEESLQLSLKSWDWIDGHLFEHLGLRVERYVAGRRPYVRIAEVRAGGPSDAIGLTAGDIIDAVKPSEGEFSRAWRIIDRGRFASLIQGVEPGSSIEIDIYRDGTLLRGTLVTE